MTCQILRVHHLAAALGLACLTPAQAVIVGGANGTGYANATESGLQSFLSSVSAPAFLYWDNLVRVTDSSGIYLGYNPDTNRGWVLTANHVTRPGQAGNPTTITVNGTAYQVRNYTDNYGQQVGALDLRLYAIGGDVGDPALPDLLPVPISTGAAAVNDPVILTGRGMRLNAGLPGEDTTAPYSWGVPGNSDANPMRWGANTIGGVNLDINGGAPGPYFWGTTFDDPASGAAYSGQGAVGDSGGAGFVLHGGQWLLAGVLTSVGDGPDADSVADPAGYGDTTYLVDTQIYRSDILAITGTLIPEPGTAGLLAITLSGLLCRRRRA